MLKNLPVAFVKIDSSIVLQIARDESAYAKAGAIHRIAHSIGIKTIAEFVESDAMIERLKTLGVDFVQGLGIAAPVPLSAIDDLDVLSHELGDEAAAATPPIQPIFKPDHGVVLDSAPA